MTIRINLPAYGSSEIRDKIIPWLRENKIGDIVYQWPYRYVMFDNDEDASFFLMKYSGEIFEYTRMDDEKS